MKRIGKMMLSLILFGVLLFGSAMAAFAEGGEAVLDENKLYARSAVLMDADSGRILYEKDGHKKMPMASTTKIMTCILTLESGKTEEIAEVSSHAASMPKVHLGMRAGERYRIKDLLYSLMLESHNDSAVAIAEHVGGSVEGFAEMMNQKAAELGCKDTFFITPNGLDAQKEIPGEEGSVTVEHSTTAADLARIMSYCIVNSPQRDDFLEITRTPSHSFSNLKVKEGGEAVSGGRKFSCNNHNAFLSMMEGALSGKTGFTGKAGYCYVGSLKREDKTFVVALLACGWPNNKTYKWSDTRKLMEYGLSSFEKKDFSKLPVNQGCLKDIPVSMAATDYLFASAGTGVEISDKTPAPVLLLKKGEEIEVSYKVEKHLFAPVEKGQVVGKIEYRLGEELFWERELVARDSWKKINFAYFIRQVYRAYFS
ncbi:D-alanyl-D-alanine carboxypeptidase family protein [Roseburia sp. 1XD42-69]|uniref:D-alanyl-D-alanine carboxypeptidase family protein n=1 Tax=Roseburia sp. 1XD42-69 TaxID=2320088 RepID=UPI0026C179E4